MRRRRSELPQINAGIAKVYGAGRIVMTRDPSGYYYFYGEHPDAFRIPSLMWYRADLADLPVILGHLADEITPPSK